MSPKVKTLVCAIGLFYSVQARAAGDSKVELGLSGATLTDGLGTWKGASGALSYAATPRDRWGLELAYASRFDEQGLSATGSWTRDYSENAYQVFSLVGTTAAAFWPSLGVSSEYLRKVGVEKEWVLGLGGGANAYRTSNNDYFGVLEAIRYLPAGWVIEAGTRVNLSMPGSVVGARGFVALSWIPDAGYEFVLKGDGGQEAYQVVGPGETLQTRFQSIGLTGEAFVPVGRGLQVHLRVEQYQNPFYNRTEGYAGIVQPF